MITNFNKQQFFVVDPISLKPIIEKPRLDVHSDGDWHFALTAFIFRKNSEGDIEVLVQERSDYVDIAQKHFDQSLATQLLVADQNDPELALFRGLGEELNIKKEDVKTAILWNKPGSMYIYKSYDDNPELWNREVIFNYLVMLNDKADIKGNFKVQNYEWLPWGEFCNLVASQPNKFTKSVRTYCIADSISDEIYKCMSSIADEKPITKFSREMYYLSFPDIDVVAIHEVTINEWSVEVYRTSYSMRKVVDLSHADISFIKKLMFGEKKIEKLDGLLGRLGLD